MNAETDILIASPARTKPRINLPWHTRTTTIESLATGKAEPARITIVDMDEPGQLHRSSALLATLKAVVQASDPRFVVLSLPKSEDIDAKVELFKLLASTERVEISEDRQKLSDVLGNVMAKVTVMLSQRPRPSALDGVQEVLAATNRLRGKKGNLSANAVAELYGVSTAQVADWLGKSRQTVSRTPEAAALQEPLAFLERIARLLTVLSEEDFRKWLRMQNSNLDNKRPLDLIAKRRWQVIADLVDDMLTGAPS